MTLAGGRHVTLLVETPRGYANLCRLLTEAHAGTRPKEGARAAAAGAAAGAAARAAATGSSASPAAPATASRPRNPNAAARVAAGFGPDRFFVELQRPYERGDARRNAALRELARELGVATVATGDVHAHHERRAPLQDALVAIRCRTSLDGSERERRGNHEAVLSPPEAMLERFPTTATPSCAPPSSPHG